LKDNIEDVKADKLLTFSNIMIFGETWLETSESSNYTLSALCQTSDFDTNLNNDASSLYLQGYELHLNSVGRGRGIAAYFQNETFNVKQAISREDLQLTVLESEDLCVIGLYRSNTDTTLSHYLKDIIPSTGDCIVIGDFNICTKRLPNHEAFETLNALGFQLVTTEATHIDGGHLDQIWLRTESCKKDIMMYSPYYTAKDHDALLFTLYDPTTEQGRV
jgi:hypothetical protein